MGGEIRRNKELGGRDNSSSKGKNRPAKGKNGELKMEEQRKLKDYFKTFIIPSYRQFYMETRVSCLGTI